MTNVLRTLSASWIYWLIGGLASLVAGCAVDDLPRRSFPDCTMPSAQIGSSAHLLDVSFTLESTTGTIGTVIWSFGDGNQTQTTDRSARHVFTIPGTYKTNVKLINACGDTVTVSKEVIVDNTVLPLVTTLDYADLSGTTATLRMVVDNKGNGKISSYGVCYSFSQGIPTLANSLTVGITGDPAIATPTAFSVGQLLAATPYYFRGFATNNAGTGYGSVISFVTSTPPSVTTVGASQIGTTTASVSFVPTSSGSPPATRYGICYSATTNAPTVNSPGSLVMGVDAPGIGVNTVLVLTNLLPNTTYSYRAFAISTIGVAYSPNTLTFTTQTDIDLTTGLIASYSFDGNGLDASGNSNNGTLMNGAGFTTDRRGKASAALQLDGVDDYFTVPDAPSLRPTSISVSLWIKPVSLVGIMQIYNKSNFADGSGEQYSSLIHPSLAGNGATINVDVKQNGGCVVGKGWQTSFFTSSLTLGTWHHLVSVFDGNMGRLYFDGILLSTDALPTSGIDNCTGGSLKFGAQYKGYENYFNGGLDDVRIYNRALSEVQIRGLFNQSAP